MNMSRLMILGVLAERGPMHGHQIRRTAELTNAQVWGGITGGALYAELRKLDNEGLVQAAREEQVGRRPARTVYEITDEGRLELVVQRDAALEVVLASTDPVSVVLLFAAGQDPTELGERLAVRQRRIAAQLEAMAQERTRLTAQGFLTPLAVAAFVEGNCGWTRNCAGTRNSSDNSRTGGRRRHAFLRPTIPTGSGDAGRGGHRAVRAGEPGGATAHGQPHTPGRTTGPAPRLRRFVLTYCRTDSPRTWFAKT
jgi:DNA-binding PadR family transcriptional regulator